MRLSHFLSFLPVTGYGACCHPCWGCGHGVLPLWVCPWFPWEMSPAVELLSHRGFTCSQMLANAILLGGPACPGYLGEGTSMWGFPLLSIFSSVWWYYLSDWQSDESQVVSCFCFLNTSEVDRLFLLVEIPFCESPVYTLCSFVYSIL